MNIVEKIQKYVVMCSNKHKESTPDKYDFWNEHIKYVYEEASILADMYKADKEIVLLGALLHDIALINMVGTRSVHHINGSILSKEILEKYNYPQDKIKRVQNCVLHHKSSKESTNIEEICVADADILSHFDNIPMIFDYAYKHNNIEIPGIREWIKKYYEKDYDDLSDKTKKLFKKRYEEIMKVLFK